MMKSFELLLVVLVILIADISFSTSTSTREFEDDYYAHKVPRDILSDFSKYLYQKSSEPKNSLLDSDGIHIHPKRGDADEIPPGFIGVRGRRNSGKRDESYEEEIPGFLAVRGKKSESFKGSIPDMLDMGSTRKKFNGVFDKGYLGMRA